MCFCALPQAEQIRLQRIAEHVHGLGPRAIAEALADALEYGDMGRLESYRRLAPDLLVLVGGDAFPPRAMLVPPADRHDGNDRNPASLGGREVA